MSNATIGKNLRNLIREKNMSEKEFAEKIGKDSSKVSKWCLGIESINIEELYPISQGLGMELSQLMKKLES